MKQGIKYSRKEGTIVWDSTQTISQPASVIQIFNPELKETQYFRFAANPDVKQTEDDVEEGKTPILAEGKESRVKFIIPVIPLQGKDKEFKEFPGTDQNPKVVKISHFYQPVDPSAMFFNKRITRRDFRGRSYEDWKSYQVMDYMGESLYSLFKSGKEKSAKKAKSHPHLIYLLNLKQYLQVSGSIIDELNSLHRGMRLHKDFHWGNILLSKKNGQIIVKLIDGSPTIFKESEQFDRGRGYDFQQLELQLRRCIDHFESFNDTHAILNSLRKRLDNTRFEAESMDITRSHYGESLLEVEQELEAALKGNTIQPDEGYLYAALRGIPVVPNLAESYRLSKEKLQQALLALSEGATPSAAVSKTQEEAQESPLGSSLLVSESLGASPAAAPPSGLTASTAALTSSVSPSLFSFAPSGKPPQSLREMILAAKPIR